MRELLEIDVSSFSDDDILFLTSATAERVVAYADWLRTVFAKFGGKVGIYTTVSAEVDDTVGRHLRRNGISISAESFAELDNVVTDNELKCSMYRYLFDSINIL